MVNLSHIFEYILNILFILYCSREQLSFKSEHKNIRIKTMIKKGSEKFPRPHLHISNNTNRKAT